MSMPSGVLRMRVSRDGRARARHTGGSSLELLGGLLGPLLGEAGEGTGELLAGNGSDGG